MADLAKYIVKLEAQTAKYERSLNRANKKLANFDRKNRKSLDSIGRAFRQLGGIAAVGLFTRHIKQTIAAIDANAKLVDRLGGSTEAFSELELVAKRANVPFRQLTIGLQRMSRRLGEAANDTGEAQGAIKELGLDARELAKIPIDKQFEVIADRLASVTSETDRLRLAFKLFDSEGVALLQTMKDGARGIRSVRLEARDLGLSLSKEQVQAATQAADAMTNLDAVYQSMSNTLAILLAPALQATAEGLRNLATTTDLEELRQLEERLEILSKPLRPLKGTREEIGGLINQIELLRDKIGRANAVRDPLQMIDISGAIARANVKLETFFKSTRIAANAMRIFRETWDLDIRFERSTKLIDAASDSLDDFFSDREAEASKTATALERVTAAALREQERLARSAESAAQQLGLQFASAFEDAAIAGEKLRVVLQGILKDIARIVLRKVITEPLAGVISGIFSPPAPGGGGGTTGGGGSGGGGGKGGGFGTKSLNLAPAIASKGLASGGGVSIVNNLSVAAGADGDKVLALVPQMMKQASDETISRMYELKAQGEF